MSGITRRDLFRGRLFGRGAEDPAAEAAPEVRPVEKVESPPEEVAAATVPKVPPPPWERPVPEGAVVTSPVAQVAPWELGSMDTTRTVPPANRRAQALGSPRMAPGRAMVFAIQTNLCLAWRHVPCSVCRERCPESGAIAVEEGRPMIVADRCTGCGDCVAVCPAPIMAIRMQRAARPENP